MLKGRQVVLYWEYRWILPLKEISLNRGIEKTNKQEFGATEKKLFKV